MASAKLPVCRIATMGYTVGWANGCQSRVPRGVCNRPIVLTLPVFNGVMVTSGVKVCKDPFSHLGIRGSACIIDQYGDVNLVL